MQGIRMGGCKGVVPFDSLNECIKMNKKRLFLYLGTLKFEMEGSKKNLDEAMCFRVYRYEA